MYVCSQPASGQPSVCRLECAQLHLSQDFNQLAACLPACRGKLRVSRPPVCAAASIASLPFFLGAHDPLSAVATLPLSAATQRPCC